jgi:hypothetical protein
MEERHLGDLKLKVGDSETPDTHSEIPGGMPRKRFDTPMPPTLCEGLALGR